VASRPLIRELAIADATSAKLQVGMDIVVEDRQIACIGPTDAAEPGAAETIDGGGATLVPALIDCHSHLSGPGGSHWIQRFSDPPETLIPVRCGAYEQSFSAARAWSNSRALV
jgi:imidazolonepropionase